MYFISQILVFLIDGATGLSNNEVMSKDDAHWFSNRLKEEIVKRLKMDSIVEIVKESIWSIQNEYKLDVHTLAKQDMPSGCISLFRERNAQVEYFGLGDCVGFIEWMDGTVETLFDDRIEKMDNEVISKMKELSIQYNIPFLQTRKYVNSILLENRNARNRKDGFYALDLTMDGFKGAIYKSWPSETIKRVACMSDGLYQITSFFPKWSTKEVLNSMQEDIDNLFTTLYTEQERDADCIRVPRLKIRDDTTGVFALVK